MDSFSCFSVLFISYSFVSSSWSSFLSIPSFVHLYISFFLSSSHLPCPLQLHFRLGSPWVAIAFALSHPTPTIYSISSSYDGLDVQKCDFAEICTIDTRNIFSVEWFLGKSMINFIFPSKIVPYRNKEIHGNYLASISRYCCELNSNILGMFNMENYKNNNNECHNNNNSTSTKRME